VDDAAERTVKAGHDNEIQTGQRDVHDAHQQQIEGASPGRC
jgi:hypothetical protein